MDDEEQIKYHRRESDKYENINNTISVLKSLIYIFIFLAAGFATYYNIVLQINDMNSNLRNHIEIEQIRREAITKELAQLRAEIVNVKKRLTYIENVSGSTFFDKYSKPQRDYVRRNDTFGNNK